LFKYIRKNRDNHAKNCRLLPGKGGQLQIKKEPKLAGHKHTKNHKKRSKAVYFYGISILFKPKKALKRTFQMHFFHKILPKWYILISKRRKQKI